MRRVLLVIVSVLTVAACGSGDGAGDSTTTSTSQVTTTSEAETTTTTAAPETTTTVAATTTSTTDASPTTTAPGATTTTLAGKPIDFGPAAGDVLMVIGVRHDDVLNLRAGPGANQSIRDEIPPTFDDLIAKGNTRELPSSFWIQVDYEGTSGWVHMGYVGYEGDTTDDTSWAVEQLGRTPKARSMTALGELVADLYASDDEPESDIVQVTPVTEGDLAEVTYDVIGLADDAVRGFRLHVFAEKGSGGFTLKSLEVTTICGRGVDDGACL